MENQTSSQPKPEKSSNKIWVFAILTVAVVILSASIVWHYFGPYAKVGNQTIWKQEFKKALPRYTKYFEIAGDQEAMKDPAKATLNIMAFDRLLSQEAKKHNVHLNQEYVDENIKAVAEGTPPGKVKKLHEYAPDLLKKEFARTNLQEQLEQKVLNRRSGYVASVLYPYSSELTREESKNHLDNAKKSADKIRNEIEKNGIENVIKNLDKYQDTTNNIRVIINKTEFLPPNDDSDELVKLPYLTDVGNISSPVEVLNGYSMVITIYSSGGKYANWSEFIQGNIRKL